MIGKLLGERYKIIEKIGYGGMATVYKAKCEILNRYVAVKVLRKEFVDDENFVHKFRRESQSAASLSHPNIVSIYDVGIDLDMDEKIHYIVMEYIDGKTLKEIITEKGKLTVEETINYSKQIAYALQHAHKNNIIHRDIKPQNIMITKDGMLKVTDFGIARATSSSTIAHTSTVLGTVHYFSPEQAKGTYMDEKSDIYSLGIVMYEMITGEIPFKGETPIAIALQHIQDDIRQPSSIDENIPINLNNIIMKCVRKQPSERYMSISELLDDFNRINDSDLHANDYDDEFATKVITPIKTDNGRENSTSTKNGKKSKGENFFKSILAPILLAFLVVSLTAYGYVKLKDAFVTPEVLVPKLIGVQEEVAKDLVESRNLVFRVGRRVESSEYLIGEIISQNPEANTNVKEGYVIEVEVSAGESDVVVPNLLNREESEIEDILANANLSIGIPSYAYSDTVKEGAVISQSPRAGVEVKPGSEVSVVISRGKEIILTEVPNLLNRPERDALREITNAGLAIGVVVEEFNEDVAAGLVFWQSIQAGTDLEPGTEIDLYVSLGPEPVEEEPEKFVDFRFEIVPPDDTEEFEVVIIRIQDGERLELYRQIHITAEGNKIVTLQGKESARFEVYYDDELVMDIPN